MQLSGRVRGLFGLAAMFVGPALVGALAPPDVPARAIVVTDLDGHRVQPLSSRAVAVVLVFTRSDCPIAARYAPEIERLQRRTAAASIDFRLVFVDPTEPVASIRAFLRDYGYTGEALRDPDHALVRVAGATTTPEAAVFLRGSEAPALVYRGRIDDRYIDVGRTRPSPTRHDLEEVIEAVSAGQPLQFRTAPAIGCLIADLRR